MPNMPRSHQYNARLKKWRQRIQFKQSVNDWMIQKIAPWFNNAFTPQLLKLIPAILKLLPASWRGSDYHLCKQNLRLLHRNEADCDFIARSYVAIHFQRQLNQHRYHITNTQKMRARIDSLIWKDPHHYLQRSIDEPTLILLPHTGEYWVAVAAVIIRTQTPSHFIIPILAEKGDLTYESIMSLSLFGHTIEILNIHAPTTALTIAKGLKQKKRVLIFCDMPVSLGDIRFGEPISATFFGRQSQFVKGPLFFASRLKCHILLLGHRAVLGEIGELHAIQWIDQAEVKTMAYFLWQSIENFIQESPANWFYLPRMETYFHFQVAKNKMSHHIPSALIKHQFNSADN